LPAEITTMPELNDRLIATLKNLKGSGKFVCSDTIDFVFPGLYIEDFGEIGFPVSETTARGLIAQAKRAPFGKGSDTIIDEQVRRTHEIDASRLSFRNPSWASVLQDILKKIKPALGIDGYEIEARPYKLLVYETGDFFLPHKDSEKDKGMFGTLVIELPAKHSGGELVVRFDGREEWISFMEANDRYQLGYAAFYADCEHEIKPVLSGYRVSLVYNLIRKDEGAAIHAEPEGASIETLTNIIREHQQEEDARPLIVLLGHQYTPENFSAASLKLNDRPKAAALIQAASELGYHARLCLVSSFQEGTADGGGYYDDEDAENLEMGEIYNDGLSIEDWAADGLPHLSDFSFEAEDLVAAFELNEGEPLMKESSGYMGNYGPDLTFWYHYGAVMIWSPELNVSLLAQQQTETQLEWIDYFAAHRDKISAAELDAARYLMATGFGDYRSNKSANMNRVAEWIIGENDRDFFTRISAAIAQSYLSRIDTAHWLQLIRFLGEEESIALFGRILEDGSPLVLERLLDLLCALKETGTAPQLLKSQLEALPESLAKALSRPSDKLGSAGLSSLLMLTQDYRQPPARTYELSHLLTRHADRNYIHYVLVPVLRKTDPDLPLAAALRAWSRETLTDMTAARPHPPADWRREVPPDEAYAYIWQTLRDFLESPAETSFDYRAVQRLRTEMETAINSVTIDLKMETVRKGSPHILRITKTQADFERALKVWEEDRLLLAGLPV
jgi:hypothetical protein